MALVLHANICLGGDTPSNTCSLLIVETCRGCPRSCQLWFGRPCWSLWIVGRWLSL